MQLSGRKKEWTCNVRGVMYVKENVYFKNQETYGKRHHFKQEDHVNANNNNE